MRVRVPREAAGRRGVTAALLVLLAAGCGSGTEDRIKAIGGSVSTAHMSWSGKLIYASFHGPQVTDEALVGIDLESLPTITDVSFSGTALTGDGLEPVARWTQVRGLRASGNPGIGDSGMKHIAPLKELNLLQLGDTDVGDEGLRDLRGLTGLSSLDLSGTRVTDAGLEHLAGLDRLISLDLSRTGVTGAGLRHLAGLPYLAGLNLSSTKVDDEALEHLAGLDKLETLSLADTPLTDAAVPHLLRLRGLRVLNLTGTALSEAAVERLRALPQLQHPLRELR